MEILAGPVAHRGTALVTGAGGFIGRWSVPTLLEAGYAVHAVRSRSSAHGTPPELTGATLHHADLLESRSIDTLLEQVAPTHLLHFAWIVTPGVYWQSADNARWCNASRYLVERFKASGGQRAVLAGSCAEYDWSRAAVCDEDTSPLREGDAAGQTAYTTSKIQLQRWLAEFGRLQGLSTAWGRIFYQYGPYEYADRLVASVIRQLLARQPTPCSEGTQVRSFLHSSDVGGAFAALLTSPVQGAVNIGSAEAITIADLIGLVAAKLGAERWVRLGALASSPSEPAVLLPALHRLRDEVGWVPRLSLNAGLDATIDWWRGRTA